MGRADELRWELAERNVPQLALFADAPVRRVGSGEYRGLEFLEVTAKRIINEVPPSFLPFNHTINAYRGCSHSCVYCFARPTHEYLGLNLGDDFDSKIVVKVNAVELVRSETEPVRWGGDRIAMGTNTDPYQPAEAKYRLTRGIVEVLRERGNSFSILTKSTLVLGDLELLAGAAADIGDVRVDLSIGTIDEDLWRLTEPNAPHPLQRMGAVARLRDAGITSAVIAGPVLPGLSDDDEHLEALVDSAATAGASGLHVIPLHLKAGVKEHYLAWLQRHYPDLVPSYERRYARRAYQPASVARGLNERVRALIERRVGPRHPLRSFERRPMTRRMPDAPPKPQQRALALGD